MRFGFEISEKMQAGSWVVYVSLWAVVFLISIDRVHVC